MYLSPQEDFKKITLNISYFISYFHTSFHSSLANCETTIETINVYEKTIGRQL